MMSMKFIATVTATGSGIDFKFELDDSELKDPIERKIAESIAAAGLLEVKNIKKQIDSLVESN